jgi:hypothetical protein
MLPRAVSYYHELLAQSEIAQSSRSMLDQRLESAKLNFGGRRLTPYLRPHFVTEDQFSRVTTICEIVWSAIQKVKDAAVEQPALLDDLGLTEIERELVSIDPGYRAVSPTARLDSFLTPEAYSFVELNGESPAGIAYADVASEIFSALPVMQRFAKVYEVRALQGRRKLMEVLLRAYEEWLGHRPERPPHIAIVDLKGLPTQNEIAMCGGRSGRWPNHSS